MIWVVVSRGGFHPNLRTERVCTIRSDLPRTGKTMPTASVSTLISFSQSEELQLARRKRYVGDVWYAKIVSNLLSEMAKNLAFGVACLSENGGAFAVSVRKQLVALLARRTNNYVRG